MLHPMAATLDNETGAPGNASHSLPASEPIWISLSLISIIIFTVGGNSLVCIAVLRERHLQNTTNYFLTSLAITDCLVACLVMPIAVAVEFIGYFPFDPLTCNIWLTFDVCCSTASIWHMSVMSLNRYQTLRYPLKYGRNKRRSLVAYKIIAIWLISFAICLPLFILGLVDSSNVYNDKLRLCFAAHSTFKIYGSVVAFFIPLIIMIVTYALTMTALQQAHTTKRQRSKRQRKIRAVVNLAAMAIRWKRAVNTVEIPDEKPSAAKPEHEPSAGGTQSPSSRARKRASSLLASAPLRASIFVSSQHVNEHPAPPSVVIRRHTPRENQLRSFPEKPPKQSSNQNLYLSTPNNLQASTPRSSSFTPLLDVNPRRKNRRRSSSVHTLLQIRRNSAKISEELANLSAQLSASTSNTGMASKRASLSVPTDHQRPDHDTPTIAQLLAEASVNEPIVIPTSFLSVKPKRRRRSNSADIRLSSFDFSEEKSSAPSSAIPNLLITRDSANEAPSICHDEAQPPASTDTAYQRIRDWLSATASSSSTIEHVTRSKSPPRWISAANITENTPILASHQPQSPPLTQLKKHFPRIEQLYGQTSMPNTTFHSPPQQQHLLVDDHVASAQSFVSVQRPSIYSLTSSLIASRATRNQRVSVSSSLGSSSLQGAGRPIRPRLNDIVSQVSFQMVSLDTDDTSSCTSSLTYHSAQLQSAITGNAGDTSRPQRKKRQRFKSPVKKSATNERKAMRVLLIIFSIFVILWTPFFIITLVSCFVDDIHPVLMSVATWLGYSSSCANPIIYTIFSRTFRQTFFNILTCRKTVHPRQSSLMFSPSAHSKTMSVGRKFSALSRGHGEAR